MTTRKILPVETDKVDSDIVVLHIIGTESSVFQSVNKTVGCHLRDGFR